MRILKWMVGCAKTTRTVDRAKKTSLWFEDVDDSSHTIVYKKSTISSESKSSAKVKACNRVKSSTRVKAWIRESR